MAPDDGYIRRAAEMCREMNVLLICDEIQTGIARTGSLLAVCGDCTCEEHCEQQPEDYIRPDILILGKALSRSTYPISAILGDQPNMDVNRHEQYCSTYGVHPT